MMLTTKEQYQRACHLQRLIGFLKWKEEQAPEPIIKWAIRYQLLIAKLELNDFPPNMRDDAFKSCPVWHHSPLKNRIGTLQVHSANPRKRTDGAFSFPRLYFAVGKNVRYSQPQFLRGRRS